MFYALWLPDLFMERVQNNGQWSLFCPNEAPGLADCWGAEFETLYTKYEREVSPYFIHVYAASLVTQIPVISIQLCLFISSGKGQKGCSGAAALVRNIDIPGRNRNTIHAFQGK